MNSSFSTEDGYAAWLRYAPLDDRPAGIPTRIVALTDATTITAALQELRFALPRLLDQPLTAAQTTDQPSIILGTVEDLQKHDIDLTHLWLKEDGFAIQRVKAHLIVTATNPRGILYGAFALLRRLENGEDLETRENPSAPIRYLNHWDNPGGTIERGYAGRSIFFTDDPETEGLIHRDLTRVVDYARLLASIGINGISVNNVNADDRVYTAEGLREIQRLADAIRPYGVQTLLSLSLDSPRRLGGLDTFDPLDPDVVAWWNAKVAEIYALIPDFAGLVLKADSEGRLGPSAYGRTHADAANLLARALQPYGGLIFYRGFVYNHKMDWRDLSLDRAKAAYDNFAPLDGQFEPNVTIQIKNGPIDFQVREPASPAFLALSRSKTALEFMITQEYLGQQHHTVYEVPWWKDTLEFDFQVHDRYSLVRDEVSRGYVAVCGVGRDRNWMGNHLAQANLYGYGRLVWNLDLSAEVIAREWTRQTLSRDPEVVAQVEHILMRSWPVYENYTGNLGIGGLTDIIHIHYGPSPISSEHNGWGQWHRSNATGTGMNRTWATGTGFTGQYPQKAMERFENLETCPEELLLFFHHVPYTHRLKSGKTVIQHFYDAHYEGAAEVEDFIVRWKTLRGRIDESRFSEVLDQLEYQAGHALVWRDSVCQWFARLSGIPDDQGRVFHEPNRIEAESMQLAGYEVVEIEPWEAASGGRAVALPAGLSTGTASFSWPEKAQTIDLHTWYFDPRGGHSTFTLSVNGQEIDRWTARRDFPTDGLDAHSRTRRITRSVALRPGDLITIQGFADRADPAGIDFVEWR